ncbi:response regulator transcription factor [Paenibacillus antri]|uniref:Response regulator transcription factor n=1 Tax=Paenibacillus antri TaxID=2582848 RepID=A0A5R9GLY5_9BACL|nr:response regulator transcription factor [Paenibacillus antri]TLS54183.1 response regulator transcription factor [Paenibacillus antri]
MSGTNDSGKEAAAASKSAIRVLLVDDHAIVRQGLVFYLGMQNDLDIVGEAANGVEAVSRAAELKPDVILMDLFMPEKNGIEATRDIRAMDAKARIIVLTSFSEQDHVLSAIKAGANGYLLKDADPADIANAIRGAHAGRPQLHPAAAAQLMSHVAATQDHPAAPAAAPTGPASPDALTPREAEILSFLARGYSNKEIAAACGIAEKTVKTHVSSLLSKLGVADRTQAALYAVKNGLVES